MRNRPEPPPIGALIQFDDGRLNIIGIVKRVFSDGSFIVEDESGETYPSMYDVWEYLFAQDVL